MQYSTDVRCPICKDQNTFIVAEVDSEATVPMEQMPIGPGSRNYFRLRITSFHCSNPACMVAFFHPPGKPEAGQELLQKIKTDSIYDDF